MKKKSNKYTLCVLETKNFLFGQIELYKIQFSETSNNGYLEVMNSLNNSLDTVQRMSNAIDRLAKQNTRLKRENSLLKENAERE